MRRQLLRKIREYAAYYSRRIPLSLFREVKKGEAMEFLRVDLKGIALKNDGDILPAFRPNGFPEYLGHWRYLATDQRSLQELIASITLGDVRLHFLN